MKRALLVLFLSALVGGTGAPRVSAAVSVGDKAPPVKPIRWLNFEKKNTISWTKLKGRLILVEKWATWSLPCRRSIPHLNKLTEKYRKRGLTIIGVTREPAEKVKPFIERLGMKYLVAIRGAERYTTRRIPHAWLIDPEGKCVWKGHPASLKEATIEKYLRGVSRAPSYDLPGELSTASNYLNRGMYGKGVKALESYLENAVETRRVVDEILALGRSQLEEAERKIKAGKFDEALRLVDSVRKSFAGHDLARAAKEVLSGLKTDKELKLEFEAAAIVNKARDLMKAGKHRAAAGLLKRVTTRKKYAETRMLARARRLREVARKNAGRSRP